jgi:tRNA nucleotidyltransferase (CCA-adding enzyme)
MERDTWLRTAADIMTPTVYALKPGMAAREAVIALAKRGFSGAPVVDAEQRLLGIVTELDMIHALATAAFEESPPASVEGLMTRNATTAEPRTDIFQLAAMLEKSGHRCLPIVSRGQIVGLVTRRDVARALAEMCEERCAARSLGTIDAMAELEQIHNPFPAAPRTPIRRR